MTPVLLADLIVVVHLAYVGFVVFGFAAIFAGAALGWGWVRHRSWRLVHLAAMGFVGIEAAIGMACPLTVWEFTLRAGETQPGEAPSFIGRMSAGLLYYDFPPWVFTAAYLALTALAVALWWLVPPSKRESGKSRA
jgi:hypothetical protein